LQAKKKALKEKWSTLTPDEKMPFEKLKRDHLAKQSLMKESITDALKKEKGGNCVRSYASLAKVITNPFIPPCYSSFLFVFD
jgi:hypothetical protein